MRAGRVLYSACLVRTEFFTYHTAMKITPLPEKKRPAYPVLLTAAVAGAVLTQASCQQQQQQQQQQYQPSIAFGGIVVHADKK